MKIKIPYKIILAALIFTYGVADAEDFTVGELFVSDDLETSYIEGIHPGGQFGAAMDIGDINGDGIEEIAVGSSFSSTYLREWNGAVSIYRPGDKEPYLSFFGVNSGDQFGSALQFGDFNGDGIDDLAIGAYNALAENGRSGVVYLIYGKKYWKKYSYDFNVNSADVVISGFANGDNFGQRLAKADLNGDGIDDLLVGAPMANTPEVKNAGMVFGFFGNGNRLNARSMSVSKNMADITYYGIVEDEKFGSSISAGRLTDNGEFLVIGAYNSLVETKKSKGRLYFYKLYENPFGIQKKPFITLEGDKELEWFAFSLDIADVNGDEIDDILVGSFPYKNFNKNGRASLFLGGDLFNHEGALYVASEAASTIIGNGMGEAYLGAAVKLDDLDGNGLKDIIIGAPGIGHPISGESGDVYVFYNYNNEFLDKYSVIDAGYNSVIHGEAADDWFGFNLVTFDYNNNGYKDLIVASRYSKVNNASHTGKIHIIPGKTTPLGRLKTISSSDSRIISRGEFISLVIQKFDLKNKKADFIESCYSYQDFCFYNFVTMSNFQGIKLNVENPVLYPDVPFEYKYYKDISIATVLGLINGYMNESDTPFYPEKSISRIQALKIVLTAADLVKSKYRFELVEELGGEEFLITQKSNFVDISAKISYMWWYPRYANFAWENGIITKNNNFRPDDPITYSEVMALIEKTQKFINRHEKKES